MPICLLRKLNRREIPDLSEGQEGYIVQERADALWPVKSSARGGKRKI